MERLKSFREKFQNKTKQNKTSNFLIAFASFGLILILNQLAVGQTSGWSNSTNLTNSTIRGGDVGIGMIAPTEPTEKLQVAGNIRQGNNLFYSDAGYSTINFNCKYNNNGSAPFKLFAQGYSGQFTFGVGLAAGDALSYA